MLRLFRAGPLAPGTKERAAARPALTSPKRTAVDVEWLLPHWSLPRFSEMAPAASGPRSVSRMMLVGAPVDPSPFRS